MNLEDIKRNYENFDDEKLIEIATKDIQSLRKEVIPILEAELLKRNLSLADAQEKTNVKSNTETNTKKKKEDKIFTKENIAFMNSFEIPHILKNGKAYYVKGDITTIFSILLAVLLVLFLFKSQFGGGGVKLILWTIIASILIKLALKKMNFGKIAEVQPTKIILPRYPTVNFGMFRIMILIRIASNQLGMLEFNYRDISRVYQKDTFTNKGYYLDIVNSTSRETESHRVFLEVLSENDRNQILEIIKQKSDNVA